MLTMFENNKNRYKESKMEKFYIKDLFSMNTILKRSMNAQKKDYYMFNCFGSGEIILLYGTSSAGKSTICRSIKIYRPQYTIDSLDDCCATYVPMIVKNLFPDKYKTISKSIYDHDILMALRSGTFKLKKNIPKKISVESIMACQSISIDSAGYKLILSEVYKILFNKAFFLSKHGITSVIDLVHSSINYFYLNKADSLFECIVTKVLVYCSIDLLCERIKTRNETARENLNHNELRIGLRPLFHFTDLFKLKKQPNEVSMASIDIKKDFSKFFSIMNDEIEKTRIFNEFNQLPIELDNQELILLFKKICGDKIPKGKVDITPIDPPDFIVDNTYNINDENLKKTFKF